MMKLWGWEAVVNMVYWGEGSVDEDKIIGEAYIGVMHLSEHSYGAGLFRVCIDLVQ